MIDEKRRLKYFNSPVLGATHVQRACCVRRCSVLSTLCFGIAVRLTASSAARWRSQLLLNLKTLGKQERQ